MTRITAPLLCNYMSILMISGEVKFSLYVVRSCLCGIDPRTDGVRIPREISALKGEHFYFGCGWTWYLQASFHIEIAKPSGIRHSLNCLLWCQINKKILVLNQQVFNNGLLYRYTNRKID